MKKAINYQYDYWTKAMLSSLWINVGDGTYWTYFIKKHSKLYIKFLNI